MDCMACGAPQTAPPHTPHTDYNKIINILVYCFRIRVFDFIDWVYIVCLSVRLSVSQSVSQCALSSYMVLIGVCAALLQSQLQFSCALCTCSCRSKIIFAANSIDSVWNFETLSLWETNRGDLVFIVVCNFFFFLLSNIYLYMDVAIAWTASAIPSIAICRASILFLFCFLAIHSAWCAIALTVATVVAFVVSWLWFYFLQTAISRVPFIVTVSFRFISFVAVTYYNAACSHANQTAGGVRNGTKLAEQHRKNCVKNNFNLSTTRNNALAIVFGTLTHSYT